MWTQLLDRWIIQGMSLCHVRVLTSFLRSDVVFIVIDPNSGEPSKGSDVVA